MVIGLNGGVSGREMIGYGGAFSGNVCLSRSLLVFSVEIRQSDALIALLSLKKMSAPSSFPRKWLSMADVGGLPSSVHIRPVIRF